MPTTGKSVGKVVKGILGAILIIVGIGILIVAALMFMGANTTSGNTITLTNPVEAVVAGCAALFGLAFVGVGAKFV